MPCTHRLTRVQTIFSLVSILVFVLAAALVPQRLYLRLLILTDATTSAPKAYLSRPQFGITTITERRPWI
jgi:hypothetical protein